MHKVKIYIRAQQIPQNIQTLHRKSSSILSNKIVGFVFAALQKNYKGIVENIAWNDTLIFQVLVLPHFVTRNITGPLDLLN